MSFTSKKVKVITLNSIGLPLGIYDSVPCPQEYMNKFPDDTWLMHPTRNEPVRVFTESRGREAVIL